MSVTTKEQRLNWTELVRLTGAAAPRLTIGLMSNSSWDEDSELDDVVPVDFNGYAEKAPNFSASAINAGGESSSVSDPLTWTKAAGGAGDTVYGWFAHGDDEQGVDRLYGGDLFPDGPFDFTVDGATTTQIFFLRDKPY